MKREGDHKGRKWADNIIRTLISAFAWLFASVYATNLAAALNFWNKKWIRNNAISASGQLDAELSAGGDASKKCTTNIVNAVIAKSAPFVFILLLLTLSAFAIPQTFNIHGKLTDSNGAALSGTYNMTFRIYDSYTSGNLLWNESNKTVTTDGNGVYSVILKNINLNFSEQFYLGIEVQSDGEMSPRINLTSSPYAFRAQNITVAGVEFNNNVDVGAHNFTVDSGVLFVDSTGNNVGIGTTTPAHKLEVAGSMNISGNLNVSGIIYGSLLGAYNFVNFSNNYASIGAFNNANFTALSPFSNTNFSTQYYAQTDRFTNTNFTTRYTAETGRYNDLNFSSSLSSRTNISYDTEVSTWIGTNNTMLNNSVKLWVYNGTLQPAGSYLASTSSGWTNTSTTTSTSLDVNVDSGTFFVNSTSGNVGIGTTSPTHKLEVAGSMNISGNLNVSGTLTAGTFTQNDVRGNNLSIVGTRNSSIDGSTFYVDSTNNYVGIGTTAPGSALEVNGVGNFSGGGIITGSSVAGTGAIRLNNGYFEGYNGSVWTVLGNGSAATQWVTSGTNIYYATGNVGIGATSPVHKLEVAGSMNVSGDLNVSNNIYIGGVSLNSTTDSRANLYNGTWNADTLDTLHASGINNSVKLWVYNGTLLNANDQRYNNSAINTSTNIQNFITLAFIEGLGFNITTELKTYFDTLYTAASGLFDNTNFSTQYSNRNPFSIANYTALSPFSNANFTAQYALMGFYTDINFSASLSSRTNISYDNETQSWIDANATAIYTALANSNTSVKALLRDNVDKNATAIYTALANSNTSVKALLRDNVDKNATAIYTALTNSNTSVKSELRDNIDKNYTALNNRDNAINASANIQSFITAVYLRTIGFNITTELKAYFDTLYTAASGLFDNTNFSTQYSNRNPFSIANYTTLSPFSNTNFTTQYNTMGAYNDINFSSSLSSRANLSYDNETQSWIDANATAIYTALANSNTSVKALLRDNVDKNATAIYTALANSNTSVKALLRDNVDKNATAIYTALTNSNTSVKSELRDNIDKNYTALNNRDNAINTSTNIQNFITLAFIEGLGFNITTELKTYFDTLYTSASGLFNNVNFTTLYFAQTDRFTNTNFSTQYFAQTDRFTNTNFSTQYGLMGAFNGVNYTAKSPFSNTNFSTQYGTMGTYNDINFSASLSSRTNISYDTEVSTWIGTNNTMVNNSVKAWVYNGTLQPSGSYLTSGSSGWTNTSTTTSTSLDVNVDSGTFFVNSTSGNVGIGTTSPSKKLVVNGTTEGIMFEPNVASPVINTTTSASNSNLTITSSAGSVIIRLG